jgi:hypothetical protein
MLTRKSFKKSDSEFWGDKVNQEGTTKGDERQFGRKFLKGYPEINLEEPGKIVLSGIPMFKKAKTIEIHQSKHCLFRMARRKNAGGSRAT